MHNKSPDKTTEKDRTLDMPVLISREQMDLHKSPDKIKILDKQNDIAKEHTPGDVIEESKEQVTV